MKKKAMKIIILFPVCIRTWQNVLYRIFIIMEWFQVRNASEITLHLMAKLWVRSNMTLRTHYAHPDVEEDFGLNPHLDFWYQTASAYATPIIPLLHKPNKIL
ncbi:MAG: hypothetical protein ACLTR6_12745 [Clostridium fessum]